MLHYEALRQLTHERRLERERASDWRSRHAASGTGMRAGGRSQAGSSNC